MDGVAETITKKKTRQTRIQNWYANYDKKRFDDVFIPPADRTYNYVKRCMAKDGLSITVKDGVIHISEQQRVK